MRAQGCATELETGVQRIEQASPSSRVAVGSTESMQPLLSLDAVSVSLRKRDASRDAMKTNIDGLHTPFSNPRGRGRVFRGGRARGQGGTRKKTGVPRVRDDNEGPSCLACEEGHNLYDHPICKKKWLDYELHLGDEASKFTLKERHRMMTPDDDPG